MAKYVYRDGYSPPVAAATAAQELQRIHAAHGVIAAQAVVDASEPIEAPLHPVFEWDNVKAANEHRKWQARLLVKSVHIKYGDSSETAPVFVHVPAIKQEGASQFPILSGYQPVSVVAANTSLFSAALNEAIRRLESAKDAIAKLENAAVNAPQRKAAQRIGGHVAKALAVKANDGVMAP